MRKWGSAVCCATRCIDCIFNYHGTCQAKTRHWVPSVQSMASARLVLSLLLIFHVKCDGTLTSSNQPCYVHTLAGIYVVSFPCAVISTFVFFHGVLTSVVVNGDDDIVCGVCTLYVVSSFIFKLFNITLLRLNW